MGQQPPIKLNRKLDWTLDEVQDPETGLTLLSNRPGPGEETPEQTFNYIFWHGHFTYWRDWLAGNRLAVALALMHCAMFKMPPPTWLCKAVHLLCMPDNEKRACDAIRKHFLRWQAVELVRGRFPGDPRNSEKEVCGDDIWVEAAKLVADTDAEADPETVRKSHTLIKRAGGIETTLPSYRRAVEMRDRGRK
jgi:hypothetical protein